MVRAVRGFGLFVVSTLMIGTVAYLENVGPYEAPAWAIYLAVAILCAPATIWYYRSGGDK